MKSKLWQFLNWIPLLVFLETIALLGTPQLARSQTPSTELAPTEIPAFEPPPGDGEPDSTAGGGSRNPGTCLSPDADIVLTPVSTDGGPSVSIALPATSARALAVKIEDENYNLLYYDTLTIGNSPETLNFHLPETASSLEVGKQYKWIVAAICGKDLSPNDPTREGSLIFTSITESSPVGIDSVEQPK
jgi:Domain of Unknown Function (DUF928)